MLAQTQIWNKLYEFQKVAVKHAITKIQKHNGCIIADSVGLGKTFEALAVMKYYELRNQNVLVLCPNHNAITRVTQASFDRELMAWRYPNGLVEKLTLRDHLLS